MHQMARSILDGEWKAHRTRRVALTQHKIVTKNNVEGPSSRTRSRKKRKLDEISPNPLQGDELEHEDHQVNADSWPNLPSKPCIPEKRVLELILDVLQRRDTHEIFGEPVDPEEVEDYNEIVKEPMDFGTMRAKLHEGMYESLEQFEHDIFLITENAMHFNPSETIYFIQARVVHELATKVFDVLKTRPNCFELEFSESRLRSARRSQREVGNFLHKKCPKPARNAKANNMTIDKSQKSTSSSSKALPNHRRRNNISNPRSCIDAKDHEDVRVGNDVRVSRSIEADKRYTYKPWRSSLDGDKSFISFMSSNRKQLEHIIQKDIGYSKSLMSFVKDLGPAVQTIARQKLVGPNFRIQNCPTTADHSKDSIVTTLKSQNFTDQVHGQFTFTGNATKRTSINGSENIETTLLNAKMVPQNAIVASKFDGKVNSAYAITSKTNAMIPSAILSDSSFLAQAGESISGNAGFKKVENKSIAMLEKSKYSNQVKAELSEQVATLDRQKLLTSHFMVELPFLKSWLGQTNAFTRLAFLQRKSGLSTWMT